MLGLRLTFQLKSILISEMTYQNRSHPCHSASVLVSAVKFLLCRHKCPHIHSNEMKRSRCAAVVNWRPVRRKEQVLDIFSGMKVFLCNITEGKKDDRTRKGQHH